MFDADILMITHRRPHYTRLTLPRLLETCPEGARVWVWHNGDHEETLSVVEQHRAHPRFHRFHHSRENVGLRIPTNWLWAESRGALLGKVDDDCVMPDGWIEALVQAHEAEPRFGAISCWHFQESDFDEALASPKIMTFRGGTRILVNAWVGGSGYLLKRACIQQCGPRGEREPSTAIYRRAYRRGWIHGWHIPLIYQIHLDDPLLPDEYKQMFEGERTETPLSALRTGNTDAAAWNQQLRNSAREVQTATLDPRAYAPWRQTLARVAKRLRLR